MRSILNVEQCGRRDEPGVDVAMAKYKKARLEALARACLELESAIAKLKVYKGVPPAKLNEFEKAELQAIGRLKHWDITEAEYDALVAKPCHYCGDRLRATGVRLDRKDNDGGYTIENVVPCCGRCNLLKGSRLTYAQMVKVAETL